MKKCFLIFLLNIIHLTNSILIRPKDIYVFNKGNRPGECPIAKKTECQLSGTLNYKIFECDYDYQCPISYKCCWEKCLNFDICKVVKLIDQSIGNYAKSTSIDADYNTVVTTSPSAKTTVKEISTTTLNWSKSSKLTTGEVKPTTPIASMSTDLESSTQTSTDLESSTQTSTDLESSTQTSTHLSTSKTTYSNAIVTTTQNTDDMKHKTTTFDPFDDTEGSGEDDEDFGKHSGSGSHSEETDIEATISSNLYTSITTPDKIQEVNTATSNDVIFELSTKPSTVSNIIFTNTEKSSNPTIQIDPFEDTDGGDDGDYDDGSGNNADLSTTTILSEISSPVTILSTKLTTTSSTSEILQEVSVFASSISTDATLRSSTETPIDLNTNKDITTSEMRQEVNSSTSSLFTDSILESSTKTSNSSSSNDETTDSHILVTNTHKSEINTSGNLYKITTTDLFDDTEDNDDDVDYNGSGSGHYDDGLEKVWKSSPAHRSIFTETTTQFSTSTSNISSQVTEEETSSASISTGLTLQSSTSHASPSYDTYSTNDKNIITTSQKPEIHTPENLYNMTTTELFDDTESSGDDDVDDGSGSGHYDDDLEKEWKSKPTRITPFEITTEFRPYTSAPTSENTSKISSPSISEVTKEVKGSTPSMPKNLTIASSSITPQDIKSIDSNAIHVFTTTQKSYHSTVKVYIPSTTVVSLDYTKESGGRKTTISNTVPIFLSTQNPNVFRPDTTIDPFDNTDGSGGDDDEDNGSGSGNYPNDIINDNYNYKEGKMYADSTFIDNVESGTSKEGDRKTADVHKEGKIIEI